MEENESPRKALFLIGAVVAVLVGIALVAFLVSGPREGRVSGRVTLDDQPLAGAQVVFLGEDETNKAPLVAPTDDAGDYQLIGNRGPGIPVGKYKVTVAKMTLKDGTIPTGEKLLQARAKGLLVNVVAKIYEDPATTPLRFDIGGGVNTVNLALKKRP